MASIYTKSLQIYNAEQFKASIETLTSPYVYFTFGKIDAWPNGDTPPQANSSVYTYIDVWKNMIGAKQLQGNDARLAIRRFDWQSGQTYIAYDDSALALNMNDANVRFYIVTDEWNVYKCLSNNNSSVSTFKPTTINTSLVEETPDKYIWKYMYTLTDEEKLRFTTDNYIPVKTLTEDNGSLQWQVQESAIQGSIETVKVTNGGSGYSGTNTTITIIGDGTGANAIARVNSTTTALESIIITNKGRDYTYANVQIGSSIGLGATARVIMSPPGGHGSNPVEELGGSFVIINPRLKGSELGILDVDNEFRQIAIIKNPLLLGSNTVASGLTYSQETAVYLDSVGDNYVEDEYVYQGATLATSTFKGKVASWDSANSVLQLVDVVGNLTTDPITGDVSKASRQVNKPNDPASARAFEPYTGSLLYINNIAPIQRSFDQTEDFKIVISF